MTRFAPKENGGQFRVAVIGEDKCTLESYNRSDFYKVSLVTAGWPPCELRYGSLAPIEVGRPALVLLNPVVPHSWSVPERTVPTEGFFCVFDEAFVSSSAQLNGLVKLLFTGQKSPVYFPGEHELQFLSVLFARMRAEADIQYGDRDNLFCSYLSLIFHETSRMGQKVIADSGGSRIAASFFGLLQKQFPVDLPLQPIRLKTASDFAEILAVHVNHLNTSVKAATGKSTTKHINELLFSEAKSLLGYTEYSIAEIAFGLGFEYQSYFTRFFKKHAGLTPVEFRNGFEKYK